VINFEDRKAFKVKNSYSQSGEDLIIKYIFEALNVKKPYYMDIGAHHPFKFSNTALFYESGCQGINIEPDPNLFKLFKKYRKRDINLNIGVSDKPGELLFYVMSSQTMNTFSIQEAEDLVSNHGFTITKKIKVQVDTISNIVKNHLNGKKLDLLSVDVEGMDLQILKSIEFTEFFPTVICVETISFSTKGLGIKDLSIKFFLESKGYMKYADTYINTIFVRKDKWCNHR
jgi:FkbM family methyltransferase